MPPTLQIDIPPEQAQRILEKRQELGPYIFREAQVVCVCVYVYVFMRLVCAVFLPLHRLQMRPVLRCQCSVNCWSFGPSFKSWAAVSKRRNSFLCCRRNGSNTEPECGDRGEKRRRTRGELRWGDMKGNKGGRVRGKHFVQSELFCTGRAGEATVQLWCGGRDRWWRWGRKWKKAVEDREQQSIADSHTTGKEQSAVPNGGTWWT